MTEQPDQPQAHGVRIDSQFGHATIVVDGASLPADQITGYSLQHSIQDAIPTLLIHTRQPQGVAWQGLARVAIADPQAPDPAAVIAEYLQAVDPAGLENAALNREDLGSERYDLTRAMLRQLADWVKGEQ